MKAIVHNIEVADNPLLLFTVFIITYYYTSVWNDWLCIITTVFNFEILAS